MNPKFDLVCTALSEYLPTDKRRAADIASLLATGKAAEPCKWWLLRVKTMNCVFQRWRKHVKIQKRLDSLSRQVAYHWLMQHDASYQLWRGWMHEGPELWGLLIKKNINAKLWMSNDKYLGASVVQSTYTRVLMAFQTACIIATAAGDREAMCVTVQLLETLENVGFWTRIEGISNAFQKDMLSMTPLCQLYACPEQDLAEMNNFHNRKHGEQCQAADEAWLHVLCSICELPNSLPLLVMLMSYFDMGDDALNHHRLAICHQGAVASTA